MNIESPSDLAEFKHRVPDGLKAPGQPVLVISESPRVTLLKDGASIEHLKSSTYWTREPVKPSRPELPTAHGSVITNIRTKDGEEYPGAFRIDSSSLPWAALSGLEYNWLSDDEIVSFDYARVVTDSPVSDEETKSPVKDMDGDVWVWNSAYEVWTCRVEMEYPDIVGSREVLWRHYGPLRPADKDCSN